MLLNLQIYHVKGFLLLRQGWYLSSWRGQCSRAWPSPTHPHAINESWARLSGWLLLLPRLLLCPFGRTRVVINQGILLKDLVDHINSYLVWHEIDICISYSLGRFVSSGGRRSCLGSMRSKYMHSFRVSMLINTMPLGPGMVWIYPVRSGEYVYLS